MRSIVTNLVDRCYLKKLCLKRPVTFIILAISTCLLFVLIQYYFEDSSTRLHSAGLTRRNTSNFDYGEVSRSNIFVYSNIKKDKLAATVQELELRIEDLKRIKLSIINELRSIEREKTKVLKEKASLISRNDKLISSISKSKSLLRQLELDISANKKRNLEQVCDIEQIAPIIFNPLKSIDIEEQLFKSTKSLNLQNVAIQTAKYTLNYSLCPLAREFRFSLPQIELLRNIEGRTRFTIDPKIVLHILKSHNHYTSNTKEACLQIYIFNPESYLDLNPDENNLVIDLSTSEDTTLKEDKSKNGALASHRFTKNAFRNNLDIALPSIWHRPAEFDTIIGSIPSQSPVERKYLASYFGHGSSNLSGTYEMSQMEKVLQVIHRNSVADLFLFIYNCGPQTNLQCYDEKEKMIELSTFLIILPSHDLDLDDKTSDLIYLGLSRGAIPVIVGKEQTHLPFEEVIDWRRAAIMIHSSRLTELHFILRSISPPDLYQLKYHGRRIFENYLATAKQIIDTTISVISLERFNYPPQPISNIKTKTYYHGGNLITDLNCSSVTCLDAKADPNNGLLPAEILGPRERPLASDSYRRNYSLVFNSAYDLWNHPMFSSAFLYPSHPINPISPSEYKFISSDQGYRPIAEGMGGSGIEFSRSLGGDYINEQFTIVLLTYERESLLMKTLERLKGLPFLNKILVVWNGIKNPPANSILWPDMEVPIKVVKVNRNSLNNRFLPFDEIETDAILSLDDDSPIRQDEIIFAFRVWRESRERIVGFPGRYHAWDSSQNAWVYNSNHSCELSMVLTGGAFFHRYYSYIYSYSMPKVIRTIVDRFMNCEDIAMNFLVAHLTRKPPIKVTSRWTFHCAGCTSSLSEEDSHFRERHECLNTFASIYGYMPLLSTQHRSDSILFKTRLPHDKQKCFRFV